MDQQELARILREMYDNPVGARLTTTGNAQKPTMVHLFGILFAKEIDECDGAPTRNAREIVRKAGLPESYYTEVNYGRLLAEYVTVHDGSILRWRK